MSDIPEETKKDLEVMHDIKVDDIKPEDKPVEEPEVEPDPEPTYKDHVNGLLDRVSKGEEIYPTDTNPIHQTIKDHGVKGALLRVFNEETEPGNYQLNEEDDPDSQKIGDSDFFKVTLPSSYPEAQKYWERLTPQLRNIGDASIHPEGNSKHQLRNTGEAKDILTIELVRNSASADKPSVYLTWQDTDEVLTEEEAKSILSSAGIGAENAIIVDKGSVVEAEP